MRPFILDNTNINEINNNAISACDINCLERAENNKCYICCEEIGKSLKNFSGNGATMIKPCLCDSYVHRECFYRWLFSGGGLDQRNRKRCSVCRYEYQFYDNKDLSLYHFENKEVKEKYIKELKKAMCFKVFKIYFIHIVLISLVTMIVGTFISFVDTNRWIPAILEYVIMSVISSNSDDYNKKMAEYEKEMNNSSRINIYYGAIALWILCFLFHIWNGCYNCYEYGKINRQTTNVNGCCDGCCDELYYPYYYQPSCIWVDPNFGDSGCCCEGSTGDVPVCCCCEGSTGDAGCCNDSQSCEGDGAGLVIVIICIIAVLIIIATVVVVICDIIRMFSKIVEKVKRVEREKIDFLNSEKIIRPYIPNDKKTKDFCDNCFDEPFLQIGDRVVLKDRYTCGLTEERAKEIWDKANVKTKNDIISHPTGNCKPGYVYTIIDISDNNLVSLK